MWVFSRKLWNLWNSPELLVHLKRLKRGGRFLQEGHWSVGLVLIFETPQQKPRIPWNETFLAGLLSMFAIQWLGCKPNTAPNNATKNKQSQTSVLHYSRVVISTQGEDTQLSTKCSRLKISSPIATNTVAS